jgi:hypothetical protein
MVGDALAPSAVGRSVAALAPFVPASEKQRWLIETP